MNHEKLRCYQMLMKLAPRLQRIATTLPQGYYYMSDQLKRALSSSMLNLAEGNAKYSKKERRRFFLTSRASIAEVCSILDVLRIFNLVSGDLVSKLKVDLGYCYAMISNL